MGEGPALAASETREPVLVADLAATDGARWPSFGDGALQAGMRSANGFPMVIHGICIGALDLYHDEAMTLTETQVADALVVADVTCRTVLRGNTSQCRTRWPGSWNKFPLPSGGSPGHRHDLGAVRNVRR